MSELIDREQLHEYLDNYYREVEKWCVDEQKDICCTIISCIDNTVMTMPTVEAKGIVRARWIFKDGWITCNHCNAQPYRNMRTIDFDNLFNFCPNCGAIMDEVSEDDR